MSGSIAPNRRGWLIVALLFLVQVVNYADKSVVGLAAPEIMRDLNLTSVQYGLVAGSFFALYAVGGLLVAWLAAPRVRPRMILAAALLLWSLLQLPIVLAASFPMLVGCRVLLGMGEGAGAPTAINACYEWFGNDERNMPTSVVLFGSTVGSLISAPALSYIISLFGWRAAFATCAAMGLAVLALWLLLSSDGPLSGIRPTDAPSTSQPRTGTASTLSDRTIIGSFVVQFCGYWVIGYLVAWLPTLLTAHLGFSKVSAGWIISSIYLVQAGGLLGLSFLSQRMLKAGSTSRSARGSVIGVSLAIGALCFAGLPFMASRLAALALLAVASASIAPAFSLGPALISEVAVDETRNRVMTIVLSAMTLGAIVPPILTGRLVDAHGGGGWNSVHAINGVVLLLGAIAAFLLIRPAESIERRKRVGGQPASQQAAS